MSFRNVNVDWSDLNEFAQGLFLMITLEKGEQEIHLGKLLLAIPKMRVELKIHLYLQHLILVEELREDRFMALFSEGDILILL